MKKIKKIKIVYCPEYTGYFTSENANAPKMPPLGIAQLTAYLREKGFIVDQDDLNIKIYHSIYNNDEKIDLSITNNIQRVLNYIQSGNDKELEDLINRILRETDFYGFDMVCFSAGYLQNPSSFLISLLIAKHLKEKNRNITVIGGSICSLDYNIFLDLYKFGHQERAIDYFIAGPGEKALYKLIKAIEGRDSFNNIPGLSYYTRDNKLISQGWGEFIFQKPDFNGLSLKLYTWNLIGPLRNLTTLGGIKITMLPFYFIHGCPSKCIFCGGSAYWLPPVSLPPKEVVKRLKELCNKYNTKYFFFLSPTINFSKKYINELCDEIINNKLNILWSDCARLKDLDKNTLEKMRKAGCIQLVYGLETASPRLLKYIGKGITLEEASRILKLTNEVGIWTSLEIIAGLPTEKEEDINATLNFLERNKEYIDNIYINPYHITPGSLLKCNPEKYGIKNVRNILEFANPNKISYNTLSQIFSFDEINGLNWEEKKKQISHSLKKVCSAQKSKIPLLIYDNLPFLFALYEKFKSKDKIRKKYKFFRKYFILINSRPYYFLKKLKIFNI